MLAKPKPFDPGQYQPASRTGKVVLAELFTGAGCGPCVSADLAFDGMLERYESRDVAVLVYHLHIPGPDPMANPDAESRTKYYGVGGTSTAVFDDTDQNVAGGSASGAQQNFGLCKGKVEARTGLKPPVAIGSLNLRIEGSVATLSGEAIADADALKSPDKARLRLALVEELCGLLRFIAVTCSHSFAVSSATKATPSSHRG